MLETKLLEAEEVGLWSELVGQGFFSVGGWYLQIFRVAVPIVFYSTMFHNFVITTFHKGLLLLIVSAPFHVGTIYLICCRS